MSIALALQKHYRVSDLAGLWRLSENTIRRLIQEEPGVVRISRPGVNKRKYVTLSVPESVAISVHQRLSKQPLESSLPSRDPPRVVRLRDLARAMPEKARKVIKRKAA